MSELPTFKDVQAAAQRIKAHAFQTPLLRSGVIDAMTGKTVWFKAECNQKVGAFKYRGAYNRLSAMSAGERKRGVVATSSGNHAQGRRLTAAGRAQQYAYFSLSELKINVR